MHLLPLLSMQTAMIFEERVMLSGAVNQLGIPLSFTRASDRNAFADALIEELRDQPASRIRLSDRPFGDGRTSDSFSVFGSQWVAPSTPTAMNFWKRPGSLMTWADIPLFGVEARGDDGLVLYCHHAVADRLGVEALVNRTAARLSGTPAASPGEYALAIDALSARTVPVDQCSDSRRLPIVEADPIAVSDQPFASTLSVVRHCARLDQYRWATLARAAESWSVTLQQLALSLVMSAVDYARGGSVSRIGVPVSLRDAIDDPDMMGCFIATVALETAGGAEPGTVREVATRTRDQLLDRFETRWESAFGKDADARNGSSPAFDMIFAWQDAVRVSLIDGEVELGMAEPYPGSVPITLAMQPTVHGLKLALDRDPGRIDGDAAESLLNLILDALARTADDLGAGLAPPVVSDMLATPDQPQPRPLANADPCAVWNRLAAVALERPEQPAIEAADGTCIDYARLWRDTGLIALWATALPPGPIALLMRRELPLFVALIGLLRAGRSVALFEIAGNEPTIERDLKSVAPVAVLACAADAAKLAFATDVDAIPFASDDIAEAPARSDGAALIFTSGSSGAARPVLLGFETIARHAIWAASAFAITERDRMLQFCAVAFDAMLEELLPPLISGATVVLRDAAAATGAAPLLDACARQRITILDLPTGFFNLVSTELAAATWPSTVRLIVIGGEAYQTSALNRWLRAAQPSDCVICTTYGPTEATIVVTCSSLSVGDPPALLGATRPDARLYVLDRLGRQVPDGCVGELIIAGNVLARGYANQPRETADRFVPDPFDAPGSVMYRTGDRVRYSTNRSRFVGRIDRQIKIGGRRLELDRLERFLNRETGLAVYIHVRGKAAGEIAVLADGDAAGPAAKLLRDAIAALPYWLQPNAVHFGQMPLTKRGKVDRVAAGRTIETMMDVRSDPGSQPTSALSLVKEALGRDNVELSMSLMSAGAQSLSILRLISLVETRLGRQIELETLYRAKNLAAVCDAIETAPVRFGSIDGRDCLESDDWRAASAYEAALYADSARRESDAAYRISSRWVCDARLDEMRFTAARDAVLARHPLLTSHLALTEAGLRWKPAETPETRIDLTCDDTGHSMVTIEVSHLACDGIGLSRLASDVALAYRAGGQALGGSAVPPAATRSIYDVMAWRKHLSIDAPVSRLPAQITRKPKTEAAVTGEASTSILFKDLRHARGDQTRFVACLAPFLAWLGRALREAPLIWMPVSVGPSEGIRLSTTVLPVWVDEPTIHETLSVLTDAIAAKVRWALGHRQVSAADFDWFWRSHALSGPSILFDLVDSETDALDFGDGTATSVPDEILTTRAEIEVTAIVSHDGRMKYRFRGNAGKYDLETLEGWAESLTGFAAAAFAQPDVSLARHSLAPWIDQEKPSAWSAVAYRPAKTRTQDGGSSRILAGLSGPGVRVVTPSRQISGDDLRNDVESLKKRLVEAGITPGSAILLALPRCENYPASLLAVWQAGCFPVLVNPAAPPALRSQMSSISQAAASITVQGSQVEIIMLRDDGGVGSQKTLPAYGTFTSGTTGVPKLVLVDWPGLDRLFDWADEALAMGPDDGFLHIATPGFDIGLFEMIHPLRAGGRLLIGPEIDDLQALREFARRERASHLHFVPALLSAWFDATDRKPLSAVRVIMCGGDTVPVSLVRRAQEAGLAIQHCYGPTETTIFTTSCHVSDSPLQGSSVPLGSPIPGSGVAIVDRTGSPVPKGVVGELAIWGDAVARGYATDPRRTASRFTPHPGGHGRLYQTGDIATMESCGAIHLLGRKDRQTKIAGVRIECGAVEAVIERHPDITRAAVIVTTTGGQNKLHAFVQRRPETRSTPDTLVHECRMLVSEALPAAAVPSTIAIADVLPLTSNGKIDRSKLEKTVSERTPMPVQTAVGSRTVGDPLLSELRDLWSSTLGIDANDDTNFFKAGGDSMAAIRLVAAAMRIGHRVTLGDVFRNPSPAILASAIQNRLVTPVQASATKDTPAFLCEAGRDWLSRQHDPDGEGVMVAQIAVPVRTSSDEIEVALSNIVDHHDALRIQILDEGTHWRCRFANPWQPACVETSSVETAVEIATSAVVPKKGRMLGAALVTSGTPNLVLAVHHLAIDPSSWPILVRDLFSVLDPTRAARTSGQPFSVSHPCAATSANLVTKLKPASASHFTTTVSISLPGLSEMMVAESIGRSILSVMRRNEVIVAVEHSIRNGEQEDSIGWFTGFAHYRITPDTTRIDPAKATAAKISLNIIPFTQDPLPTVWEMLKADIPPVHPIGIEMTGVEASGTDWIVTMTLDDSFSEQERLDLCERIVRDLVENREKNSYVPTPLQEAMVAAQLKSPRSGMYHTQIVLEPVGDWDIDTLLSAWDDTAAIHDALRIRYRIDPDDGHLSLWSVSADPAAAAICVKDEARSTEDLLAEALDKDLAKPFAEDEPLSRVVLIIGGDGARVLWSHHHLILDGWSLNLITSTLSRAYAARIANAPPPSIAPLFTDYGRWWAKQSQKRVVGHWQDAVRAWSLPTNPPAGVETAGETTTTFHTMDEMVTARLKQLAKTTGSSMFEILLSAQSIVQAQRTGGDTSALKIIATVRPQSLHRIDAVAGLCMNVLPFVVRIERSLNMLLSSVREQLATIMDFATVSPIDMARLLRDHGHIEAFDTLVVFENYPGDKRGVVLGDSGELRVTSARERGEARFTLVVLPGDTLEIEILHSDSPDDLAEAKHIVGGLDRTLRYFAEIAETLTLEANESA